MRDSVKDKIENIYDRITEMFLVTFALILAFGLMFIVLAGCIAIYYGVY